MEEVGRIKEVGKMILLQLDLNVGVYQGKKCKKSIPDRENKEKVSIACLKINKIVIILSLSVKGESHY